jgi:hypothetical protein
MTEEFQEYLAWEGLISSGQALIQMWQNDNTGTWSLVTILPDGTACIFADGLSYTYVDPPIQGEDM